MLTSSKQEKYSELQIDPDILKRYLSLAIAVEDMRNNISFVASLDTTYGYSNVSEINKRFNSTYWKL